MSEKRDSYAKMSVGDHIHDEKAKMKNMTGKQKREYIWAYYKVPIICVVVFLVFAGSIIYSVFINPAKKFYLGVAYMGTFIEDAALGTLGAELDANLIPSELRETYTIEQNVFYWSEDPQMQMAMFAKFAGLVSTGDIDVMATNTEPTNDHNFDSLYSQGVLEVLDDIAAGLGIEDARLVKKDGHVYGVLADEDSPIARYNINLPVLCIVAEDQQMDESVQMLRYLAGL